MKCTRVKGLSPPVGPFAASALQCARGADHIGRDGDGDGEYGIGDGDGAATYIPALYMYPTIVPIGRRARRFT